MIANCKKIACHKHGCCIMQKCIDAGAPPQRHSLVMAIAELTQVFVRNPFGNYVVQYVLEMNVREVNKVIGMKLLGSILELGKEKFSSNVIEKCLEFNDPEITSLMVQEILSANTFYHFLMDQYGNYVI